MYDVNKIRIKIKKKKNVYTLLSILNEVECKFQRSQPKKSGFFNDFMPVLYADFTLFYEIKFMLKL